MAKDDMTPEDRLLKIIENPDVQKRPVPLSAKVRSLNLESIKEWISGLKADKNILKRINLRLISKVMAVICVIITLIWIFDFASGGMALAKRFKKISSLESLSSSKAQARPRLDVSIDDAVAQARRRNIFTFLPTKEEAASAVSAGPTLSNFKLVGILWSDSPQAMIENAKEQKTYFVAKGDRIGELDVKDIMRDKVILSKDEQDWELR